MQYVSLSEAATEELDSAYHWYEGQQPGLGVELFEEFLASVERVSASPHLYPVVEDEIRRAPLHRFPYSIFFRDEQGRIVLLA